MLLPRWGISELTSGMTHGLDFRGRYVEIRVCIPRNPGRNWPTITYSVDCRPTLGVPMLVQRNERIPTPTIDSGSRSLSFTGLYGGYAICLHRERRQDSAAGHPQIATPLPLIPRHLSGVRTLAPGPRTSVTTDYDNRSQASRGSLRSRKSFGLVALGSHP